MGCANLPNRYSALCWRPVTHAQTWASYSALYRFGRLSMGCTSYWNGVEGIGYGEMTFKMRDLRPGHTLADHVSCSGCLWVTEEHGRRRHSCRLRSLAAIRRSCHRVSSPAPVLARESRHPLWHCKCQRTRHTYVLMLKMNYWQYYYRINAKEGEFKPETAKVTGPKWT